MSEKDIENIEKEAYECGYMHCCLEYGIPFTRIRTTWQNQLEYRVCVSDKVFECLSFEKMAADIAKALVDEWNKHRNISDDNITNGKRLH